MINIKKFSHIETFLPHQLLLRKSLKCESFRESFKMYTQQNLKVRQSIRVFPHFFTQS